MSVPKLTRVFESRFHGQVYTLNGVGYDVPKLTYWCRDNLPALDIPLASLWMSKSDEKHGSDDFKKHAKEIKKDSPPIVTVLRNDGKLQIADGNHRAWNAAEDGSETIKGYIVPEADLPKEAIVDKEENEKE